jgi:hypothetical protein
MSATHTRIRRGGEGRHGAAASGGWTGGGFFMRTGGALVLFTLATYLWISKSMVDLSLHHVASSQLDSASRFKRIEEERDRLKVCHVFILYVVML